MSLPHPPEEGNEWTQGEQQQQQHTHTIYYMEKRMNMVNF